MKLHKAIKKLDNLNIRNIEKIEDGAIYATLEDTLDLGYLTAIWEMFSPHYECTITSGNGNLILILKPI